MPRDRFVDGAAPGRDFAETRPEWASPASPPEGSQQPRHLEVFFGMQRLAQDWGTANGEETQRKREREREKIKQWRGRARDRLTGRRTDRPTQTDRQSREV